MEQIIDGISHSEAELAESKNPAEKTVGFASGFLDFVRNDSKISYVSGFQFGGDSSMLFM